MDSHTTHISIQSSKRDPKPTPTVDGQSFWTLCKTHKELGDEARKRWPNATAGETFSGVTLQIAADNKVL